MGPETRGCGEVMQGHTEDKPACGRSPGRRWQGRAEQAGTKVPGCLLEGQAVGEEGEDAEGLGQGGGREIDGQQRQRCFRER